MRAARSVSLLLLLATIPGCTLELWDSESDLWLVERDAPQTIAAAYVDQNSDLHVLLRTRSGDLCSFAAELSTKTFLAHVVKSNDVAHGVPESTWSKESSVPVTIVATPMEDALSTMKGNSIDMSVGWPLQGDGVTLESYCWSHATGTVDEVLVLLDPGRRIANGELYVFRTTWGGSWKLQLPLPPIRWGSLNAIGHVAATPVCVVVDVVLSPVYLLGLVLLETGVIHGH